MRRLQLVGVYDINEESGQKVAGQFDIPYYDCLDELLSVVDAVVLATPTPLHFEQAMQCLEKGVHVLIEKPITETLEQAQQLVDKAEADGIVVQVGHIERFNPVYMEMKNILEEHTPLAITIDRLSPYQGSNKDVDVVLDLMIHDTNLILDMIGKFPEKVFARGLSAYSGTVDHAVAQLYYSDGPSITMTASRITEQKVRKIEAACWEAYLECDLLNKTILAHRSTIGEYINADKRGFKYRQESLVEKINVPTFEPLFLELQHFTECIIDCTNDYVSARDGYLALKLATQIRDAILDDMIVFDRDHPKGEKVSVSAAGK